MRVYLAVLLEEFQEEAGDDAGDAYEQIDDDEEDVRSARLSEHERRRVHHRGYTPPDNTVHSTHTVHSTVHTQYTQGTHSTHTGTS